MAASNRKRAKQEFDRMIVNVDWVLHHIQRVEEMGYDQVPAVYEPLCKLAGGMIGVKNIIKDIKARF